jgi:ATP-dependent DNA helicase DinG
MLPDPRDFGLPFDVWRPGQEDAILYALQAPQRFVGLVLPTGAGKSLINMGVCRLGGGLGAYLTATKALQAQLMIDTGGRDTVVTIQGQSGYTCEAMSAGGELAHLYRGGGQRATVDQGACHVGAECSLKAGGCEYFDRIHQAKSPTTDLVVTNYAWWLTLARRNDISLAPDILILDEAHAAPDQLASALGADITAKDVWDVLGEKLPAYDRRSAAAWVEWASTSVTRLGEMLEGTTPRTHDAVKRLRRAQWLMRSLERVARVQPALLLLSEPQPEMVRFDLVWAAPYAERHLFRGVKKIILSSATLTMHTAELLGLSPNMIAMYEGGDGFDVRRRPVYLLGRTRVDQRMTHEQEKMWLIGIDQILRDRRDRKGIIHSVSYRRRDVLVSRSEYREHMMTHDRYNTAEVIAKFKARPASSGAILVSPAVTTGYDFPYDDCDYQIISKIPFPDSRDPVVAARTLIDRQYPLHVAMQDLVQMVGRPMRAADDQCETFIVDAHARWFLGKHADLAPRWFRRAIQRLDTVPTPPPPVGRPRTSDGGPNEARDYAHG